MRRRGKTMRLSRPYKLFANERDGHRRSLPRRRAGPAQHRRLCHRRYAVRRARSSVCASIPRFQPEHFALLRNTDLGKQKQFSKGLRQLESEGAVQVLYNVDAFKREPILAVVGQLQFDVVQARLENEYNVPTTLERTAAQPGALGERARGRDRAASPTATK